MTQLRIAFIAALVVVLGTGAPALAQQDERAEAEAERAPEAGVDDPVVEDDEVAVAGSAELRQQCNEALREDAAWRGQLRQQLTERFLTSDVEELSKETARWRAEMRKTLAHEVHQQDADAMVQNRRHVIMAYGALWIITAFFVVFMFVKQQRLKDEIARLERDLREAARE